MGKRGAKLEHLLGIIPAFWFGGSALIAVFGLLASVLGSTVFGLWYPIRLHYTGTNQIEIVDRTEYSSGVDIPGSFWNEEVYIPERFSLKTIIHPDYEYVYSKKFIRELNPGDTIRVFASEAINGGFCIEDYDPQFRTKTLWDSFMHYAPFASFVGILLYGLVGVVFVNNCRFINIRLHEDIEKKFEFKIKDKATKRAIQVSVFLKFNSQILITVSFFYLIINAGFAVEKTNPYLAGILVFIGTIFAAFSPTGLYMMREFFSSKIPIIFVTRNLIAFALSSYGIYKLLRFIAQEDLSTFKTISELLAKFVKYLI